jgi:hypothetical protein
MAESSWLWSFAYSFGMMFVFVGERIIGSGFTRGVFSSLGAALIVAATGARFARRNKTKDAGTKSVEASLLLLYVVGIVALLVYAVNSDVFGMQIDKSSPKLSATLSALYPALLITSLLPMLFAEISYSGVARAPIIESLRIKDALFSGFGLAFVLVSCFAFYYVASERDHKADLSYNRTAKPGEATHKVVQQLEQPVEVSLFFPPASEVKDEVLSYWKELTSESKFLQVTPYDKDVDPQRAHELGVTANGTVVIAQPGKRKELYSIGTELESARTQLKNLDKEMQKRLILVGRAPKTVYMVTGHGERAAFNTGGDTDKRGTVRDMREILAQLGYTVKDLGAAEGLASDVPADAGIVAIVGPQKNLLPEEIASLGRYFDRGGRVFIAVDPETTLAWEELLKPFGVSFSPVTLANDQALARRSGGEGDRVNIVTGSYSSHPSVTTLGRMGNKAPMVLLGSGSLADRKADKAAGVSVDFPVKSHPATWNDKNGNFKFDAPDEQRKQWELSAASVKKTNAQKPETDGRAIILADSDALTDGVIGHPPNAYYVYDTFKWLAGDESIAGEVSNENDVPVAHTKKGDYGFFWGTIFIMPGLVLLVGWRVNRRRGRSAAPSKKEKK